jgi:formyltetrahydrofolate deformylase
MQWSLTRAEDRPRVVILVSREPHCLTDLLARWRSGELPMEIPAIISNHRVLEEIAGCYGIPFVHIPVTPETREQAFSRLQEQLRAFRPIPWCWPATCRSCRRICAWSSGNG